MWQGPIDAIHGDGRTTLLVAVNRVDRPLPHDVAAVDDRARTYSMGMKQRLGVAAALLKDPELLILDEPTNGLDPAGIIEFRNLVRRLVGEGRTVVLAYEAGLVRPAS